MSKHRAKNIVKMYNVKPPKNGAKIKYLKVSRTFDICCLDFYEFFVRHKVVNFTFKVKEEDLIKMIKVDSFPELYYLELEKVDLDDNTYNSVSLVQYYYTLTKNVLKNVKRQAHLRRLTKVESPWVELKEINRKGGRKKGSIPENVRFNYENRERIMENCLKRGWINEFIQLYRDCAKIDKEYKKSRTEIIKEYNRLKS